MSSSPYGLGEYDHIISETMAQLRSDFPDLPESGFSKGDRVRLTERYLKTHPRFESYRNRDLIVTSVVPEDEGVWEISCTGFPFLLWNTDIKAVYRICTYCKSSVDNDENCTHCGAPKGDKDK